MSFYQREIAESGLSGKCDPRHIEAWMRVEHSTLDHLTRGEFLKEIRFAAECINECGVEESEGLAQSYGL